MTLAAINAIAAASIATVCGVASIAAVDGQAFPAGGTPPTFVSATLDALGSVSTGDLVILALVYPAGGPVAAPSGWTRFAEDTDSHTNYRALYWSHYSGSNAAVNSTNFPYGLGYLTTIVYAGSLSVLQVGAYGSSAGGTSTTVAPALTNPTGGSSALVAYWSCRDNGNTVTSAESMTQRLQNTSPPTFFAVAWFEQGGVQTGTRTFNSQVGSGFVDVAILLEIG